VILARGLDRIFDVHPGWSLTVRGVTISGGLASTMGGGIRNLGSLVLVDSEVVNSMTTGAGNPGGGGIANEGSATLLRARVSRNGSTTTNNGGGVYNGSYATLTSTDTTMQGNSSIFAGGALLNEGKAVFLRSTISGNASRRGGGVNHNMGSLAFTNSTISGNIATVEGGAITASSDFSLVHTTMTLNTSSANPSSPALFLNSGIATLQNSIIEEGALACGFWVGVISSLGYNMEAGNSCVLSGAGDMRSVSAQLLPLLNTGGFTKTHRPAYGSSAIDRIPVLRLPFDQRGVRRPETVSFPLSDVGAVEA
jgi:hypothetical protein